MASFFSKEEINLLKTARAMIRAAEHPLREKILVMIKEKNNRVHVREIYKALREEQSVISSQLAILRRAGLITPKREGQRIYYALNEENIAHLLSTCEKMIAVVPAP